MTLALYTVPGSIMGDTNDRACLPVAEIVYSHNLDKPENNLPFKKRPKGETNQKVRKERQAGLNKSSLLGQQCG
jgi:hypothetical protein